MKNPLPRHWMSALFPALLLAATILAYLPALRGGYVWDDDAFVTENLLLRDKEGLWRLWFDFGATDQYYPLSYTSFWLEYAFVGLNPMVSHWVNILLHGLNAILLWRVLKMLEMPGAWLAAVVFALHPVEVESVAWITERKNVLSGAFYLTTALVYFHWFQPLPGKAVATAPTRDWRFYPLVVILYLFALWSKTVTCSLPVALLLALWWKQGGRIGWRDTVPLVPLLVIGAGMGLATAWLEKHVVGAAGQDWHLSLPERFLVAGRALWFYLGKLAWPTDLIFIYPRWTPDASVWWQWIFPLAAVGLGAALWLLRRRVGLAPLVAGLFFALTLFPALGFVDVYPFRYSFVADHFQYLASIGPIALAAAGIATALRWLAAEKANFLEPLAGVALALGLGWLTWGQAMMYKDIETLYRTIIKRNPQCWMAYSNLGFEVLRQGKVDESIALCERAVELKSNHSEAHVNLANALLQKGRIDEAVIHYEKALEIKPDFAEAHSNLGNVRLFRGETLDAIQHYKQALEIRPDYAEAHNNMGYALLSGGQIEESIKHFKKALKIQPDYKQAQENLDNALRQRQ